MKDNLEDDNLLALKLLKVPGARHLELLRHEFTILTSLRHPNIARVFDFGFDEKAGSWFYTSEFLEGRTITETCKGLSYADQSRLFAQVLRALAHIHSQGIVHYDVKPGNIIVVADQKAKLIDFGLATTETPVSSAMRGTIGYAAPEVVRGELGDPRSDLYSLGVVFYRILTGKRPFADDSVMETLRLQATLEPEGLRTLDENVPPELERIILRLLERKPAHRYFTAGEVNRALSQAMDISLEEETTETAMAYLLSGDFVGRDGELKRLHCLIDALAENPEELPIWFISGETGIGKSRMLHEAGYHAQLEGMLLVRSRCTPSPGRPFGPLADIVRNIIPILPKESLAQFSTAIKVLAGETTDMDAAARDGIFHEAALMLIDAAKRRPVVISIDDLDAANEETLAFLKYLAQMLWLSRQENGQAALLVLGAYNTEADPASTAIAAINQLTEHSLAEQISLSRLSGKAERELLSTMLGGSELPKQVIDVVLRAAGGNPLIIKLTAQQLFESGLLFYETGKWRTSAALADMQLPVAGDAALRQKLEALPESERTVVDALACIGRPADFELINTASGTKADECAGAIEYLLSRHLLSADDEGGYAFASGHMGKVARDAIADKKRKKISKRVSAYLEKTGGNLIERALLAEAADIDENSLRPLLKEAAKLAKTIGAMSDSILLYEALKRHVTAHTEEWFETLSRLAEAYWQTAKMEKALECLEAADHDSLWKYPKQVVPILSLFVPVHLRTGAVDRVETFLKNAREVLSGRELKRFRAEIFFAEGHVAQYKGDTPEARRVWLESRRIFARRRDTEGINRLDYYLIQLDERTGRYADAMRRIRRMLKRKIIPSAQGHVHNAMGILLLQGGKREEALEHFHQALQRHEKAGRLVDAGCALANIGAVYRQTGEYEKALDAHSSAKRLLEISGDEANSGIAQISIGDVHFVMGRMREALSAYEQALETALRTSNTFLQSHSILQRGMAHSSLGRTRSALADFNEAIRLARDSDSTQFEGAALFERAYLFSMLCGDFEKAKHDLEKARSIGEAGKHELVAQTIWLQAQILVLNNEIDKADSLALEMDGLLPDVYVEKLIAFTRADISIKAGRKQEAAKLLESLEQEKLSANEECELLTLKARHALASDNPQKALEYADETIRKAEWMEDPARIFRVAAVAAEAAAEADDDRAAREYIEKAEKAFEKIAAELPETYDRQRLPASPFFRVLDELREKHGVKKTGMLEPATHDEDSELTLEILRVAGVDERLPAREGLALIGMITRLATTELEVGNILELALGMVLDITRAERGFIILVDEKGKQNHLVSRNIRDDEITSTEYETSHTMVREVIRTGRPRLVVDTSLDESLKSAKSIIDLGLRSVVSVPIPGKKRTTGVVYVDSTSPVHFFGKADLGLLEAFAERIGPIISNAVEQKELEIRLHSLQEEARTRYAYTNIIGQSKPMRELYRVLDSVTGTDLTVYIYGETGTGKELVARALHHNGSRKDGPFVSINCAAMTESLLESELFGHVKGAFTGAGAGKAGLIESAADGTLFLDEIGSMPLEMQVKLLRVIEEREVRRIGAAIPVAVDIRLVCSTNTPLEQLVEKGLFREDLFYRLNVVRIDLPPLRERREDIPLLARHFVKEFADELETTEKHLDSEAQSRLCAYDYPGNIRQLRNIIQQALVSSEERISAEEIASLLSRQRHKPEPETAVSRELSVDEYMKEFILAHQDRYGEIELAKKLGIGRTNLWKKRKAWGIPRPKNF
ncbi:MAG: tetratricopeptide repeat protein [Planctomycetota bacterium]|nr:MAG: tetratricopeptide repeat protein [Planctomycetota bacterium]